MSAEHFEVSEDHTVEAWTIGVLEKRREYLIMIRARNTKHRKRDQEAERTSSDATLLA